MRSVPVAVLKHKDCLEKGGKKDYFHVGELHLFQAVHQSQFLHREIVVSHYPLPSHALIGPRRVDLNHLSCDVRAF